MMAVFVRRQSGFASWYRSALAIFLFCSAALSVDAQQLIVTYLDGMAEMQSGKNWVQLSIGDLVLMASVLRLPKESYIELGGAGACIRLSRPGTYRVQALVSARRELEGKATGALDGILRNLVSIHGANRSAVMGARGANESTQEQEVWMNSTASVFVGAGKDFLKSEEFPKAIDRFRAALSAAVEEEKPEIKYSLALAYSLNGNTRNSLKEISAVLPTGSEEWAPDYLLLKAKLLVDTNGFKEAIELLTAQSEVLQKDERRATIYFFLLALGYRGIGDTENERKSLSMVIRMSPVSNIGYAALELLEDL